MKSVCRRKCHEGRDLEEPAARRSVSETGFQTEKINKIKHRQRCQKREAVFLIFA